jgi:vesicular inhibitory amino acid transporter
MDANKLIFVSEPLLLKFAGFNVLCGVGILTTAYGIKEGGWISLLLLPLLGGSSCYTGLLLKRCIDSSPNIETYPDIGQAAFGIFGRIFVSVCNP